MKKPLVSLVVPIYNMGHRLEKSISSFLNQDYVNTELILVDDGSTDNSFEICKKLEDMNNRIRVIHTDNRGSGPARNAGIHDAKGEYVYFPDADDYLESNAISVLVDAMNEGNYDLVVFGYKNVNTKGEQRGNKIYPNIVLDGNYIRQDYGDYMSTTSKLGIQGAPWNKFFKMSIIRKNNIEYPSLRRHQDEGFIGRYMCYVQNVCFISNVLYTYYTNDLQLEWKKYPIDYIDAVIGLYDVRKETILTWNKSDYSTRDLIHKEYICNVIKSLELSFSPKFDFDYQDRLKWMEMTINRSNIASIKIKNIGLYQKLVMTTIRKKYFRLMYILLALKIKLQSIL